MANSLLAPSAIIGLMGSGPRRQNSLLPFPVQADELDELMFRRAPNGYVETPQGTYFAAEQQAAPVQPQSPAQRGRVNPLNVLFRGLAPNLSGALDTERALLQAEADRPQRLAMMQENERIARALGPQALLAFRSNPEALGESLGYQYRPQVVANGAIQSTPGMGQILENRDEIQWGDDLVSVGRDGVQALGTRAPTYAERNVAERNRIDAIGAGQRTVGRYVIDADGRTVFEAPDDFTLGSDQRRYENGALVAENPKPNAANDPAIRDQRIQALEGTAGNIGIALGRSRELARNAGTWNQYNPLARQARVDLENNLNTIKANLTFDKLNELKSASPTGASGLGALSNQEGILLASTVAALSVDMSPQELERSFRIIDSLVAKMNQSAQALRGSGQSGNAPPPPPGFVLD